MQGSGHFPHLVDLVEFSGKSRAESLCPRQVQTTLGCKVLSTESLRQSMWGLVRKITLFG